LGASVLLRLRDSSGSIVTVLADGGIKAKSYDRHHVAAKVQGILPSTDLDLVIGTHYDEDHLAGVMEVADRFSIREAILPPVRQPRRPVTGTSIADAQLLDASDLPLLIDLDE
jgi:glyoxylase-like metal-dependent hydrolase (beta-lactamase superfamily II)